MRKDAVQPEEKLAERDRLSVHSFEREYGPTLFQSDDESVLKSVSQPSLRRVLINIREWVTLRLSSTAEMFSDMRQRRAMNRVTALRVNRGKHTLTLRFNGSIQSEMSLSKPNALVLSYTRTMTGFLLFAPAPQRIVMIGLGGGSLAKWCHEALPNAYLQVLEISQDVIGLRSRFQIPTDNERFQVVLADGAQYVRRSFDRPDVLLVDGYDLDGLPSRQTCTQDFYDDCFRFLADNGVLVVNLDGARLEWIHRIRRSFSNRVIVVTPSDGQNRIAFAVKGRVTSAETETLDKLAERFTKEFTRLAVHVQRYGNS